MSDNILRLDCNPHFFSLVPHIHDLAKNRLQKVTRRYENTQLPLSWSLTIPMTNLRKG